MTPATTAPGPTIPPEAAAGAAVLTESLGKTYPGGTVAVTGLNLAVRRGEVLGLLGPNGAGKSTTAGRCCSSTSPPPAWTPKSPGRPRHHRRAAAGRADDHAHHSRHDRGRRPR